MNSGVKFALYSLAAILFIAGLNSLVNGEKAAELILWILPFLCLGTGIGIPVFILAYEAYFSNEDSNSHDDDNIINSEENFEADETD